MGQIKHSSSKWVPWGVGKNNQSEGLPKTSLAPAKSCSSIDISDSPWDQLDRVLQTCGLKHINLSFESVPLLHAILLYGHPIALVSQASWSLIRNLGFPLPATCSGLLGTPYRESNAAIHCVIPVALWIPGAEPHGFLQSYIFDAYKTTQSVARWCWLAVLPTQDGSWLLWTIIASVSTRWPWRNTFLGICF